MAVIKLKTGSKKAYFFTIDALIALGIIIVALALSSLYHNSKEGASNINLLAEDMITTLAYLKIDETNNPYINELIANGTITDLNNTVLEQIGEFWVQNMTEKAQKIIQNLSHGMIPPIYGFGFWIDDENIFLRNTTSEATSLTTSKKMVSGYQKEMLTEGYIARAWARKIVKNTSVVIPFSPEGAGWLGSWSDRGTVEITKNFEIPSNANISASTFYISIHNDVGGDDWQIININNGACTFNRNELYLGGGEGIIDKKDITGCINIGNNTVKMVLKNYGYNAHMHPGTRIEVEYTVVQKVEAVLKNVTKRFYFDNVLSIKGSSDVSGAWALLPFYIPEDAQGPTATLHLNLKDVDDVLDRYYQLFSGWKYQDAWDIRIYINSDDVFWQDNPSASNDIDDGYYDGNPYNYSNSWDITDELVNGTNVVTVYVNNYGDDVGGRYNTTIYSDSINDPVNSSYIEVNYQTEPHFEYGTIDITLTEEFGGSPDNDKTKSFNIGTEALEALSAFAHILQQYSMEIDAYAGSSSPPPNLVFRSPSARAVPTSVYIPQSFIVISNTTNNYVRIKDDPGNDIYPESAIEYTLLFPSQVPYGGLFENESAAQQDALARLNQTLGDTASAVTVELDSNKITNVPTLWGPAIAEARIWQ
jgi:hypothetical protein